jgi:hypothetical protein
MLLHTDFRDISVKWTACVVLCASHSKPKKYASVVYENYKLDNEVLLILLPVLYIVDMSKSRMR